jgi:hypothetical protein
VIDPNRLYGYVNGSLNRTTCENKKKLSQKEFLPQYFDLAMLFDSIFCKSVERVPAVALIQSGKLH